MRKKICILLIAAAVSLSACGRIPGIDSLDRSSQASEETKEQDREQDSEADDREDEESGRKEAGGEEAGLKRGGRADGDDGSAEDGSETQGSGVESGFGGTGQSGAQPDDESGETDSYRMGVITDDGWESQYWNLRYTAPEGLYMLSEEGLDALMGLSVEMLSEKYTERQQAYLKMTTLYEMMSMNATGDVNAAITVEKLLVKGMDTEDYKKAAILQLRLMQDPVYEILDDSGTAEIAGETYAAVKTTAAVKTAAESDRAYLQDYYFRVVGDRALILLITYTEDTADTAEEILNGFEVY